MTEYGWAIKDRGGDLLLKRPQWFHHDPHPADVAWFEDQQRAKWNSSSDERVVCLNKETLEEYVGE